MRQLTPSEAFGERMREAREAAGLSQAQLSARLNDDLGIKLNRQAIIALEAKPQARRVSLDEALAISACLGVAPVHLMVPFESERVISEEAAEEGIFEPTTELKVGDKLALIPIVARMWIRGTAIYPSAPLDLWPRYYVTQVPPAVRYRLRQLAAYVREHEKKLGRWKLPPLDIPIEERPAEMALEGFTLERRQELPAPLWTWFKEEENDG
jgi:transcriptional regulator with XRE-family HTH domain